MKLNDWIYIYRVNHSGETIYDRSMPRRGCLYNVDQRIKELRKRGLEAFYTIGEIFPGAFY